MNILYVFFGIFVVLTGLYTFTNIYENKRFTAYLSILSVFSTLTLITSFINSIQLAEKESQRKQKQENDQRASLFLTETEKYWVDLEKLFITNYPYGAQLYSELYPKANLHPPSLSSEQQAQADDKQYHICQILHQTIENIISTQELKDSSLFGWQQIFNAWSASSIFRKNWIVSKEFYNPSTQKYIDELVTGNVGLIQYKKSLQHN